MKCTIPEISWHNRDPVLSVDIQPVCNEEFYRLASGGTDCHVLIWHLTICEKGAVNVEVVSDLSWHQRAINVVRWSPSGLYLATGDDDANIIIWNLKTDNIPLLEGDSGDKETWVINKILRGHRDDIYDISWSPNGLKLISGSVDNTAILWDITRGSNEHILSDHKGFVQGVAWDPKGEYIATLSNDGICRIYDSNGKHVRARVQKGILPVPESHALFNKEVKYFHDQTFKSFFRRLNFSPDGTLLITPSGYVEGEDSKVAYHATFVFTLDCLLRPAAILPSPKQATNAVSCCPLLFELQSEGPDPFVALPYRMVIAVAADNDVILYDTQQFTPVAHLQKIHYTRITDLTWSSDGLLLIASSTDGFCTLVTFEPDELGVQYTKEESETDETLLDISGCEELEKSETEIEKNKNGKEKDQTEPEVKKPSLLEQWAIRKPKADTLVVENVDRKKSVVAKQQFVNTDNNISTGETVASTSTLTSCSKQIVPKRIAPIKIADIVTEKVVEQSTSLKETKNEKTSGTVKDGHSENSILDGVTKQSTSNETDIITIDDGPESSPDMETTTPSKSKQVSVIHRSKKRKVDLKKNYTPSKCSPLLKFFQTSSAKSKSAQKSEKIDCVSKKKISDVISDVNVIEITDDDSSTESASISLTEPNSGVIKNAGLNLTEDMKVLKTAPDQSEPNCTVNKQINIDKFRAAAATSKTIDPTNENKEISPDIKGIATEKENMEIEDILVDELQSGNEKLTTINSKTTETCKPANSGPLSIKLAPKTPRRIPFVTISSPKRKKKE